MERQQLEILERKQAELNQKKQDFDDIIKKKVLYDQVCFKNIFYHFFIGLNLIKNSKNRNIKKINRFSKII